MSLRIKKTELCEENYMPGKDVLRTMLGTKKHTYVVGEQEFPGLIDYNDNPWPILWFSVAVILEFIGLGVLMGAGLVWFAAFALFAIDLALAFARHLPVGKILHQKNILTLTNPGAHKDEVQKRIGWYSLLAKLASLGIVAIALTKIIGFFAFVGTFNAMVLFIIATYLIVAIIHLTYTGYFIWWFAVEWRDWLGHGEYCKVLKAWQIKNRHVQGVPCVGAPHEIKGVVRSTPVTIEGLYVWGYVVDRHVLINNELLDNVGNLPDNLFHDFPKDAQGVQPTMGCTGKINEYINGNQGNPKSCEYTLFTWGLFTDDEVRKFANFVPSNQKQRKELALHLVEHQLINVLGLSMV